MESVLRGTFKLSELRESSKGCLTSVDLMGYLPRDSAFPRLQHSENLLISFERQLFNGIK